ncbi:type II secretion system protein GspL [Pantoea sp. SORGH_AS_0659]|uniref:type II secretion system protein GspL n=1 Tax=Pantoea sp. SORGH_AS_0659 TaxID=3062597 RepID=UPI00285D921B|nr:type II secretion system protein GspL [Pantoea sp. SORGH_AS_0659]MDR6352491.1 type II secretion system protein L [Pantoea sp. SORGH_AS_0659]
MFKACKSRLIIRLPSATNPLLWCLTDSHGKHSEGTLDNLPASDGSQEVWVLVPASCFIFMAATPPRINRQTIEWELEEFALDEPQDLHITLLSREGNTCHIAAIAKCKMEEYLSLLKSMNIIPHCMWPDILTLPPFHAVTLGAEWIVRDRLWQGFAIETRYREMMQHRRGPEAPVTELSSSILTLAQGYSRKNPDLLHGEFRQQRKRSYRKHFLMFCFTAFLAGMVAPPMAEGMISQYKIAENERLAEKLYKECFGSVPDEAILPALRKAVEDYGQRMRNSNVFYTLSADEVNFRHFAPFIKKMRWEAASHALKLELNQAVDISDLPQKTRGVWSLSDNNRTLTVVYP